MTLDIEHKADIENLVNAFYQKIIGDKTIGSIFTKVAHFSFEVHIPIMINFWASILFGASDYKGNPMLKHIELHKIIPLTEAHFNQWLFLWEQTITENFEGTNANQAINKAKNIAALMHYKISEINNLKSII